MSRQLIIRRAAGIAAALFLGSVVAGAHALHTGFAISAPLPTPSLPTVSVPTAIPSIPVAVPSIPVAVPTLPVAVPTLPGPTPTLPIALPSVTPSLPLPSPVPSLPLPSPVPSLPIQTPGSPSPTAPAVAPSQGGSGGGVGRPSDRPSAPPGPGQRVVAYHSTSPPDPGSAWIVIPPITVPADALGVALLAALVALPLLAAIGLIVLGRVWGAALSMRSSRLRMALASDLELSPRELAALTPAGLIKLRDQVAFDDLTGVLRRVAGIAAAEREFARARRSHSPLTAVFVDLDGLKRVNDSRGHQAGDSFIRAVATTLRDSLRGQDLVFRYGGDEFVCILPGVGEEVVAEKFAQLRARSAEAGVRFSYGVAELRAHEDLVGFLGRADQRLYEQRTGPTRSPAGGRMVPIPVRSESSRASKRPSI